MGKISKVLNTFLVCGCLCGVFILSGSRLVGADNSPIMGHDSAANVVVAKVNGVDINMDSLMEKMLKIAQKKYGRREISDLVAQKIKDDAMDQLIVEELAYQKSRGTVGSLPEGRVESVINQLRADKGGEEAFAEYLKKQNLNLEKFRLEVERAQTVKAYLDQEINDKITISDDEIKAAYMGAKDKYFLKQEKVQVTDIIFFLDPKDKETNQKVALIREKIINELDKDATQLIPDGTFIAQENIKLNKNENIELYEVAKTLGPFGVSGPVIVDGTLHVVQLTGYEPEVAKKLEDVRDYLVDELTKRKKRSLTDQWISGLKDGAKIEIVDVIL